MIRILTLIAHVAKLVLFVLTLGAVGFALLAEEVGPWVFGVFPAIVVLATITIAVSRSMKLRAAMHAAEEDSAE